MAPMESADIGVTKPEAGVMDTRPATAPDAAPRAVGLPLGSPVLASALVACDCRIVEIKAVASHNVIFAVVEAISLGTPGPALVYHARTYKTV